MRRFTVLAGDIKLQISNAPASWGGWMTAQGSANSVTAAALLTLTSGEMEDLLDPLPDNRRVIPRATIPVRTATVRCQRKYECSGGRWVRTDEMRKNSSESEVTTETIGGRPVSTVGNLVDFLDRARSLGLSEDGALGVLYAEVVRQSQFLAYLDVYQIVTFGILAVVPLSLLLHGDKNTAGKAHAPAPA